MILRKLANAIREQNWFTVIIEILIVVIGIFLGLQVSEWNEDRKDRFEEGEYIQRLHLEVEAALYRKINRFEHRSRNLQNIKDVLAILASNDDNPISGEKCNSIYEAHIFVDPRINLPTVSEMVSTGRISNLRDETLKGLIQAHLIHLEVADDLVFELQLGAPIMAQQHANIIQLPPSLDAFLVVEELDKGARSKDTSRMTCNLAAMKDSQQFKNDLISNGHRQLAYVQSMNEELAILKNMHERLDQLGAIFHVGEPSGDIK